MESPIQELLRKAADAKKFPTQANPVDDLARKLHATNRMPYYCTRCGTWHRITEGCGWLRTHLWGGSLARSTHGRVHKGRHPSRHVGRGLRIEAHLRHRRAGPPAA